MKNYVKYVLTLFICVFVQCDTQQFYGDTFYTVEGTIVNSNDVPITAFQLQVLGIKLNGLQGLFLGSPDSQIVIAKSATDKQGRFRITFPNNDGKFALQVASRYQIVVPAGANAANYQGDMITIEKTQFSDFYRDLGIIKVRNQ